MSWRETRFQRTGREEDVSKEQRDSDGWIHLEQPRMEARVTEDRKRLRTGRLKTVTGEKKRCPGQTRL